MRTENASLVIRRAIDGDTRGIWEIFQAVVGAGDSYAFAPDTTFDEFLRLWLQPPVESFVAVSDDRVVGSYFLKPVQPGLGSHIANAGYMTHADARGQGIGEAMARHSLETARRLGYRGVQFNFVVSTNAAALRLWKKLGFTVIGTVPGAFRHARSGYVDVCIMFRSLLDPGD